MFYWTLQHLCVRAKFLLLILVPLNFRNCAPAYCGMQSYWWKTHALCCKFSGYHNKSKSIVSDKLIEHARPCLRMHNFIFLPTLSSAGNHHFVKSVSCGRLLKTYRTSNSVWWQTRLILVKMIWAINFVLNEVDISTKLIYCPTNKDGT